MMDRRTFVAGLGAGLLIPQSLRQGTPSATPAASGRPDPVDLGSGITLIDYRLHPGEQPHVIGEIRNDTDRMIDAPVVSLTYPRHDQDDGFTWAASIIPVIEAGGTVPIFGSLPGDEAPEPILGSATFALCTPAEPGQYTRKQQALRDDFVITISSERIEGTRYNAQGTIANTGPEVIRDLSLRGIVRDSHGRIAGTTAAPYWSSLAPGASRDFSVWAARTVKNKSTPFPLLNGTDYTVDFVSGTRGPVASPGCSFGRPWD